MAEVKRISEEVEAWVVEYPQDNEPALEQMSAFIANPLWEELHAYLQAAYKTMPQISYSGCGMRPGWNAKYKKGGKALCTLYPARGGYTALVVIGAKETAEAELLLPALSTYVRDVYAHTQEGMGQRWLMIDVRDSSVLEDVKRLIALRVQPKQQTA